MQSGTCLRARMRWGQTDGQCKPILCCSGSLHTWANWLYRILASVSEAENPGRCTRSPLLPPRCLEKQLDGAARHLDAHWNCRGWMEDLQHGIVGGPRSAVRAVESVLARVARETRFIKAPRKRCQSFFQKFASSLIRDVRALNTGICAKEQLSICLLNVFGQVIKTQSF